jgi:hypothetical protein
MFQTVVEKSFGDRGKTIKKLTSMAKNTPKSATDYIQSTLLIGCSRAEEGILL